MILSLGASVLFLIVLIVSVWYNGSAASPLSAVGTWSYEIEGRAFEMIIADGRITIDNQTVGSTFRREGDLVFLITDPQIQSGQNVLNQLTFVF